MKRIIPFFAVCLVLSVFQTAVSVGAETTRSAQKRDQKEIATTNIQNVSSRQKTDKNHTENTRNSVGTRSTQNTNQSRSVSANRSTVKNRTNSSGGVAKKTISRTKSATVPSNNIVSRSATTTKTTASRVAISPKTASNSTARAAELNAEKISTIKSQDYSKCKSVYYDCMDEFCANKDTGLRRCSCSSRIHEFDNIKQQLSDAEDKMMDFNQRLLTVGLDKEDAAAINVATEGEIGYSTKDTSASEKLLRKITDTLNSSGNSKLNNDLSAISLSLDVDSAWDSIDSLSGISTTSKNGLDLYNAARPVCVEMAKEVCSDHELEVIQSNYKLAIQQDCNTVAKSYDSKYNQAIEKIHESSALLDMSRLNAYQQRNSDDILTCKKKILDKMSDSSVCGENLHKCLDVTGQYIDPGTGNAFLSGNLYNITNLLTTPTGAEEWSNIPQNQQFVSFLNSKKTFLESATDQCQDIADMIWKDFLNDALGQIKLAQNAKIEEIRQSCTTLVGECKSNTLQSLLDFDARALSTFEVIADSTTNAVCADVENSCIGLLNASGGGAEWTAGITEIAANISYNAILNNCSIVGKDCIIQQCNGTGGNFSLCENFASAPRRNILKHDACWNEVLDCVKQSNNLANISIENRNDFYEDTYGINNITDIPNPCDDENTTACLITEQIWGNCEHDPSTSAITTNQNLSSDSQNNIFSQNMILQPVSDEKSTLLSWLAYNTGTTGAIDSCSAYNCPINYKYNPDTKTCQRMITSSASTATQTSDGESVITMDEIIHVTTNHTNKCPGGAGSKDNYGNCCQSGLTSNGICVPSDQYVAVFVQSLSCDPTVSVIANDILQQYYCAEYNTDTNYLAEKQMSLYCVTTDPSSVQIDTGGNFICNGHLVLVDQYGNYISPLGSDNQPLSESIIMSYNDSLSSAGGNIVKKCKYKFHTDNTWRWYTFDNNIWQYQPNSCNKINNTSVPQQNEFMITYQ